MDPTELSSVKNRLQKVKQEILETCSQIGRDPNEICLVAVSKLQNISKIHEAYRAGHIDFAENYVQEANEKIRALQISDIRWHLIGPIQSNKINKVVGSFCLIHSVDSLKIAQDISERAVKNSFLQPILLQLNLADEKTKSGFSKSDFESALPQIQDLPGVDLQGLMTMPPLEKPEPSFAELQKLGSRYNLKKLSMGTTADWKLALKYGSTHIRIGTAIFGERKA
jgi:PLP dependent protein